MKDERFFLFDIGNVLVDFDFQFLTDRIAADSGRSPEAPSARDTAMHEAVEKGEISDAEFVAYLNEAKGLSWSIEEYIGVWCDMFSVNPAGRRLFVEALERNLPVYTLSNIAGHHMDAIERNEPGFFEGAAGLFLSYRLGVRKPDPAIYQKALDALGAEGAQCFFIDDRPENVAAAREAGIHAQLFVPEHYDAARAAAERFFS